MSFTKHHLRSGYVLNIDTILIVLVVAFAVRVAAIFGVMTVVVIWGALADIVLTCQWGPLMPRAEECRIVDSHRLPILGGARQR